MDTNQELEKIRLIDSMTTEQAHGGSRKGSLITRGSDLSDSSHRKRRIDQDDVSSQPS